MQVVRRDPVNRALDSRNCFERGVGSARNFLRNTDAIDQSMDLGNSASMRLRWYVNPLSHRTPDRCTSAMRTPT